jgi:hypothetical protein
MQAAIHPGSCADAGPVAMVVLNNPAPSGSADDLSGPLLSYTEAPMALTDLLAAPHALFVTFGGDIDSALACGDFGDSAQDGALSVEVQEQNDSGFTGIALVIAAGESSRISVVLDEASIASAMTAPAPPATPGPDAATPAGIQKPTPATPTGIQKPTSATQIPGATPISMPIPALTPDAATPAVGTPTTGKGQDSPYRSEQFGYAIAFDPPWQVVYGPEVDAASDYIVLSNGTSFVDFWGLAEDLTAPECMQRLYEQYVLARPGVRSVVPHVGSDSGGMISTPEQAIEAWDITYVDEAGQRVEVTYYASCLVLQPGQALLVMTHEALLDEYPVQAALREQLYIGVTVP